MNEVMENWQAIALCLIIVCGFAFVMWQRKSSRKRQTNFSSTRPPSRPSDNEK